MQYPKKNQKSLGDLLAQSEPSEWIRRMQAGEYTPEDLRRLLGDQTQRVVAGDPSSLLKTEKGDKPE